MPKAKPVTMYQGPNGESWSGRGLAPRWITALEEEGHSKDEYLIKHRLVDFKATPGDYQSIPIELIEESPFNPRKTFHDESLRELAESIKEMGVLQPIRLRPMQIKSGGQDADGTPILMDGYEVIFGHRRFRAAKLAMEMRIPAMVSTLTDAESAQLQAVENLQREDLDPIEEAEGYADYIKTHGVTKQELAEHIKKSRTYVYNRLKLESLCDSARAYVRTGQLDADLAIEIARLPTVALQESALSRVATTSLKPSVGSALKADPAEQNSDGDEPADQPPAVQFQSFRSGRDLIEMHYKRHLDEAKFDRQVLWLVPDAPDCGSCPQRAGNMPELNAIGRRADICTNPTCFDSKDAAHIECLIADLRQLGGTVLDSDLAMFRWYDKSFETSFDGGKYLDLDSASYRTNNETPRELLGTKLKDPDVVYVLHPQTLKTYHLVEIETLYRYDILQRPAPKPAPTDGDAGKQPPRLSQKEMAELRATRAREEEISNHVREQMTGQLMGPRGLIAQTPLINGAVTILLQALFNVATEYCQYDTHLEIDDWVALHNPELGKLFGGYVSNYDRNEREIRVWDWLRNLDAEHQGKLCLELALMMAPTEFTSEDCGPDLLAMAGTAYGIDQGALLVEATDAVDNPPAEKPTDGNPDGENIPNYEEENNVYQDKDDDYDRLLDQQDSEGAEARAC